MLSGKELTPGHAHVYARHMEGYLLKPVILKDLNIALNHVFNRNQQIYKWLQQIHDYTTYAWRIGSGIFDVITKFPEIIAHAFGQPGKYGAQPTRVLYVDDEPAILEVSKLYLEHSHQFTVDTAISAKDVLNAGRLKSYDVIVADYQMPGMNGIEFLKEIRSRFGDIPFILNTGKGSDAVVSEAIKNGADFYLEKGGDSRSEFTKIAHTIAMAVRSKRESGKSGSMSKTILYVDDEPLILDIGKRFLEKNADFTIYTTESASQAFEMLKKYHIDAIVADYQMPEMDGISFLKEVHSRFGDIPFIFFTGKGREEVVIEALNNGADYYIQKGGDPRPQFVELAHKIRMAIGRRDAGGRDVISDAIKKRL